MTTFTNGAAAGKSLQLLRMPMPYFLRVVKDLENGEIDALDQADDEPEIHERTGMKTKAEFVEEFRYELLGMMLDAVVAIRSGAQLAVWLRNRSNWTDQKLSDIWDEAHANWKAPTLDQLADDFLARFAKLSDDEKKAIKEKKFKEPFTATPPKR